MNKNTKNPIQPIYKDENGTFRFKENEIVRFLLDAGCYDMNNLALMNFSNNDREQFAQLIGYSLGGFWELPYVSEETYNAAELMSHGLDEKDARIESLEKMIKTVREGLRIATPAIFSIHPDDLCEPQP